MHSMCSYYGECLKYILITRLAQGRISLPAKHGFVPHSEATHIVCDCQYSAIAPQSVGRMFYIARCFFNSHGHGITAIAIFKYKYISVELRQGRVCVLFKATFYSITETIRGHEHKDHTL